MREAFVVAANLLRDAGIETPELDARLLLCHAAGLSHEAFMSEPGRELTLEVGACLEDSIERRIEGEPVSRITGRREFYGREFLLGPHTLDPRPDTETLIEAALEMVEQNGWRNKKLDLLDLGTGTGCILLTLLAELPKARGIGADISEDALAIAAANARRLGLQDRAAFIAADWLGGIEGEFDLILANPPYIETAKIAGLAREVKDHDPHLALDGGVDGLDAYRRIASGVKKALRPGGALIVEIGASQADAARDLFSTGGLELDERSVRHDLSDRPRALVAKAAKHSLEQNVAA